MATIKELKQKAINKFMKKYNLKKYSIVQIKKHPLGRIEYFGYNEEFDEPYAAVKFKDDLGGIVLGRRYIIYPDDFKNGIVNVLKEEDVDYCVHFFEYGEPTGKFKKVLTLGGWSEKEVYRYKCRYCGIIKYDI